MGEVYRARDSKLQRDVALKVLPRADSEGRRRFTSEALALAALNHPNIVTIHAVEHEGDTPYLVMELVSGQPLTNLVRRGGMPLTDLLALAIPVAEALAASHARGIIHRDLKPANVMLTDDGRVKVLDFGLARQLDDPGVAETRDATSLGTAVGTLMYMSPEQARGEPLDARTDIFSVGVMLYELATGRHPFAGSTVAAISDRILNEPVAPVGGAYAALDGVLARALAKRPQMRQRTALELLADLRAAGGGGSAPSQSGFDTSAQADAGRSVAVLPFENMSADPDQAYFCDGMAEELISALARIKGLSVAARTSTFQLKGQQLTVQQIAERLKVKTVLEGSVRKMGSRLRITAQLVDADTGFQLWSDRYDRTMDDVFAIQDEIARAITSELEVTLTRRTGVPLVKRGTADLEAYTLYLRGRYLMNRLDENLQASIGEAIECLDRAIALDARFAAAHASLAEAWNFMGYYSFVPAGVASAASLPAAHRAVELDPTLPEAYTALGWTKTLFAIDLRTAEQDFLRALDMAPNAPAHIYYAVLLAAHGRFDEAMAHALEAQRLDPLWMIVPFAIAQVHLCARRFEPVEQIMRDLLAISRSFVGAYWYLSIALAGQGRHAEAVAELEPAVEMVRRAPLYLAVLGLYYAKAGREQDARAVLAEVQASGHAPQYVLALLHGAVGEMDAAHAHLAAAIEGHEDQVFLMATDPRFDHLKDDPRFDARLREMGLAPSTSR
jgi:eukaryotic-like serine/threonine-protein kinase